MTVDIPFVRFPDYWYHDLMKLVILLLLGLIIAYVELKFFSSKSEDTAEVKTIKPLESSVIPTYIGLFVIMLGFQAMEIKQLFPIILLLFVLWCIFERNYYFNIFWSLLGYRFYEVEDINGNVLTLISKNKDMKNGSGTRKFENLSRINNFTFLEVKK
jgi:hypothetical protein